jgi:hypothetical protein
MEASCDSMTGNSGGGLEEIGEGAFGAYASLQEISIPPAVKAIKDLAFAYCTPLTTVSLGEGLEEIGQGAFRECTSLQRIVIPESVTIIDDEAIRHCSSLTRVCSAMKSNSS